VDSRRQPQRAAEPRLADQRPLRCKRAIDWSDSLASRSFTQLAGARSMWDITARWDAGCRATAPGAPAPRSTPSASNSATWCGRICGCLWLQREGFDAPDLAGEAYTQRGAYLHLSFKFDESLFGGGPLAARAAPCTAPQADSHDPA